MEAGSVILQGASHSRVSGKRIFLMSPIHHHFELKGWAGNQSGYYAFGFYHLLFAMIGIGRHSRYGKSERDI